METIQQYESNLMWDFMWTFRGCEAERCATGAGGAILIQPLVDTVDGCEILHQLIGVLSHYL